MSKSSFRAAAVNLCSTEDVDANLALCRRLVAEAADQGARLIVLPECFAFLGRRERDKLAVAESLEPGAPRGPIVTAVVEMARSANAAIIAGGLPEKVAGPEGERKAYNTCIAVAPDGDIVARYRKIHLFDVDIPGGATLRESDSTAAGSEVVVVETPMARVGLSVCYDVRFPELYREMVVGHGAALVVVPAAFTAHTGKAHWHTLLRARAIENQVYLVAAAQYGRHNDKRASFGHSVIYDPWGDILAERAEGEGVIVADIDLERLARVREQMPCLDHQVLLR